MPFVDYLKKIFGINDSRSQSNIPSNNQHLDVVDRQTLDVQPYHNPASDNYFFDDADQLFQQVFHQTENLLKALHSFGFFSPSGLLQSPDPHHDPGSPFNVPSSPESGVFPFHGFSSIFGPGGFQRGIFVPTIEEEIEQERVSPRDEVLKPSYRSSPHIFRDEDYDDLVKEKGPDVILDILRKSEEEERNSVRPLVPEPRPKSHFSSKFSSTTFSYVNGQSVQEQITSLPDGTFEKRVTTTGPNGETSTVISNHSAEEVMPSLQRRGLGGGLFGGGGGGGGALRGPFW